MTAEGRSRWQRISVSHNTNWTSVGHMQSVHNPRIEQHTHTPSFVFIFTGRAPAPHTPPAHPPTSYRMWRGDWHPRKSWVDLLTLARSVKTAWPTHYQKAAGRSNSTSPTPPPSTTNHPRHQTSAEKPHHDVTPVTTQSLACTFERHKLMTSLRNSQHSDVTRHSSPFLSWVQI